jgi:hypothetical protein
MGMRSTVRFEGGANGQPPSPRRAVRPDNHDGGRARERRGVFARALWVAHPLV